MSGIWFFNVHCSWEDWVSMLIGMVIAISPWLAEAGLDVERRGTRSKQVICGPSRFESFKVNENRLGILSRGVPSMCDYSLHNVASRPAKVGDKLTSTRFCNSITRAFAAVGEPNVAVCLLPGTEIAFEKEVQYEHGWSVFRTRKLAEKVARFRQVDKEKPDVHHDALEFPNGQIVLVNGLCEGQHVTVLQLPASPRAVNEMEEQKPASAIA